MYLTRLWVPTCRKCISWRPKAGQKPGKKWHIMIIAMKIKLIGLLIQPNLAGHDVHFSRNGLVTTFKYNHYMLGTKNPMYSEDVNAFGEDTPGNELDL